MADFELDESGTSLLLKVGGSSSAIPSSFDEVVSAIEAAGYGDLALNKKNVLDAIAAQKAGAAVEANFVVAERLDGSAKVSIPEDEAEAYIIVAPAQGGKPVSREQACQVLRDAGVKTKLDHGAIDKAVSQAKEKPVAVAFSVPPQKGEDGRLVLRIQMPDGAKPQIDDRGRANLRELGLFVNVKAGDPLVDLIPPKPGMAGTTVLGKPIPAKDGKAIDFTPGEGTQFDAKNKNRIVAAVAGRPVFGENSVHIDPNLEIRNVNVATGNVRFQGDVTIKGDVQAGFIVQATGNVNIGGIVEGAIIRAGGSIIVGGGVIGNKEVRDEEGKLNPQCAQLIARGYVEASFVNNARVEAGKDINVKDSVVHSELVAGECIFIGEDITKKGQLIGGLAKAGRKIAVNILGSKANVRTRAEVASELAEKLGRYNALKDEHDKKLEDIEKLARIEARMRDDPTVVTDEVKEKYKQAIAKLLQELNRVSAEYYALYNDTGESEGCSIEIARTAFGNATVACAGLERTITIPEGPSRFTIERRRLSQESL